MGAGDKDNISGGIEGGGETGRDQQGEGDEGDSSKRAEEREWTHKILPDCFYTPGTWMGGDFPEPLKYSREELKGGIGK